MEFYVQDAPKRVAKVLYNRAVEDSADYAEVHMTDALTFFDESKELMFRYIAQNIVSNGYIAEFGVYEGYSINLLANFLPERQIYGFDSFRGLSEDWRGHEYAKGAFNLDGNKPQVAKNVNLIEGYFEDTLSVWLGDNLETFSYIGIDCDTYESTSTVLKTIGPQRLTAGTLILFDEYFGYHNWRNHEYKAWQEFVADNKIEYDYLALNHLQVLVRVKKI